MARIEDITVGSTVKGINGNEPVSVVAIQWYGSNVIEITYKNTMNVLGTQLLYRDDENGIEVLDNHLPWGFDADGNQMKLASEAYRISLVILRTTDSHNPKSKHSNAIETVENILNTRGTSPRIYRNMLAFIAPDQSQLEALRQEVKRFIAWTSILSDKEDLNLDGNQIRETNNNLTRSNDTVELRLKETYCWLMVPFIDQYEDMKTIQWEITNIGGGAESIVSKAARKMIQGEQIITNWAPALLQMSLDDLLWKDSNDISIKKLWEHLTTYCYLPRLANYGVLENAVTSGMPSDEFFALAAGYANDRYIDLKFNQAVFSINQSDLLVKTNVALKQIVAEAKKPHHTTETSEVDAQGGSGTSTAPGGTAGTGTVSSTDTKDGETDVKTPSNKHFYMSADLDTIRVNKDVNTYLQEIIQHLMAVDGAQVSLKLEVDVVAEDGIPANTVRTVSENCRTLKVTDFGFDD